MRLFCNIETAAIPGFTVGYGFHQDGCDHKTDGSIPGHCRQDGTRRYKEVRYIFPEHCHRTGSTTLEQKAFEILTIACFKSLDGSKSSVGGDRGGGLVIR